MKFFYILFLIFTTFSIACNFTLADFTSASFEIKNPTNFIGGGQSSSASFQYTSTTGQLIQGIGESANFEQQAGSLYVSVVEDVTEVVGVGGGGGISLPGLDLTCRTADLNCDTHVDILDLSILLFYLQSPTLSQSTHDLNQDLNIDLADISIVFYYWDV